MLIGTCRVPSSSEVGWDAGACSTSLRKLERKLCNYKTMKVYNYEVLIGVCGKPIMHNRCHGVGNGRQYYMW